MVFVLASNTENTSDYILSVPWTMLVPFVPSSSSSAAIATAASTSTSTISSIISTTTTITPTTKPISSLKTRSSPVLKTAVPLAVVFSLGLLASAIALVYCFRSRKRKREQQQALRLQSRIDNAYGTEASAPSVPRIGPSGTRVKNTAVAGENARGDAPVYELGLRSPQVPRPAPVELGATRWA